MCHSLQQRLKLKLNMFLYTTFLLFKNMCAMKNMHMNLLKTTFTIFVVAVCNSMCRSENTFNSDKTKLHNNINDAEELFKRITSNDVGARMSTHRARHTPSYLFILYNALEEFPDLKQEHSGAYPKIRSFRGLKGVRNQKESLTTFPLSNVKWTGVTRMEVVIKLSSKTRNRTIADLDQTTTLFFYKERNEISNVGARIYDSYLIFDVSVLKDTNRGSVTIDNSLVVGGRKLKISRRNEALLLIYEHLEQNPLLNKSKRVRRQTSHVGNLLDITGETDAYSCRRYDWYIDMATFDSFSWWLMPRDYNAGFCSGQCLFPLTIEGTNSTSYSFMKNIWHSQTFFIDDQIPRACCVPVDYDPLQILYVNNETETGIMFVSDMKVKSCGCR